MPCSIETITRSLRNVESVNFLPDDSRTAYSISIVEFVLRCVRRSENFSWRLHAIVFHRAVQLRERLQAATIASPAL